MKRMTSRKSHSWWWDSHMSPKNSRWLSENLEQMDLLVKEMLKLIEEEGDSFAKKAEMYYQRRPQLISHVEDFYRMYRALAERYDIVTGELRKNMPSDLQSQSSGSGSDFGAETPTLKQSLPKSFSRAAGFDAFLGSSASLDFSRKGTDDDLPVPPVSSSSSSSSSESGDSDSEDGNVLDAFENTSGPNDRIILLQKELLEATEKLKEYEKHSNGRSPDDTTVTLEAEISAHKGEVHSLKEAMEAAAKQFEAEISLKDRTIEVYKAQHDAAMNKFMQEKLTVEAELKNCIADLKAMSAKSCEAELHREVLEAEISNHRLEINCLKEIMEATIDEYRTQLDAGMNKIMQEKSILEAELKSSIADLKLQAEQLSEKKWNNQAFKIQALEDRVREMEAEKNKACNESAKHIDELNRSLGAFKLKIDMLASEKDDLNARVRKLVDDVKCRDDNCDTMSDHLHQLHIEQVNLIKENEEARKESVELMDRVRELEEEVEKQRVVILDGAEGKREAIRQLCFCMEHYRDGYEKLREMLLGHNKRIVVMAT